MFFDQKVAEKEIPRQSLVAKKLLPFFNIIIHHL